MDSGIVTNWSKTAPRFPWVTLTLFLLCVTTMLLHSVLPPLAQSAMLELGGVLPYRVVEVLNYPASGWLDYQLLTLLSALFIHTSWLHLLGNMAYLWVFGIPGQYGLPVGVRDSIRTTPGLVGYDGCFPVWWCSGQPVRMSAFA